MRDDPRPTAWEVTTWADDRRDRYRRGQAIDDNPTRNGWTIDGREMTQVEFLHHDIYLFFADRYRKGTDRFISALLHLLNTMEIRTDAKQGKRAKPDNEHKAS